VSLPHCFPRAVTDVDAQNKAREVRLRRVARRRGLLLFKSRRRDIKALDYGLYVLVENSAGNQMGNPPQAVVSAFERGDGSTLDDIETELDALPDRG
jgi:hypothetical protein